MKRFILLALLIILLIACAEKIKVEFTGEAKLIKAEYHQAGFLRDSKWVLTFDNGMTIRMLAVRTNGVTIEGIYKITRYENGFYNVKLKSNQ